MVHLVGVLALRFQEQLVLVAVGECHQFGLDAGTVTGTDALDLSVEKR